MKIKHWDTIKTTYRDRTDIVNLYIIFHDKDSLQMARNNYAALNAQLLDELPKLYDLSLDVVRECIGHLVQIQRDFYKHSLQEMYKLLGVSNNCLPRRRRYYSG